MIERVQWGAHLKCSGVHILLNGIVVVECCKSWVANEAIPVTPLPDRLYKTMFFKDSNRLIHRPELIFCTLEYVLNLRVALVRRLLIVSMVEQCHEHSNLCCSYFLGYDSNIIKRCYDIKVR